MRIWRADDLLLPMRATSSCHRCRSRAGWRDLPVLSGCRSKPIMPARPMEARAMAEVERGAGPGRGKKVSAELTSFRQFIEQLGLDRQTALEAQRIGKMPEEEHCSMHSRAASLCGFMEAPFRYTSLSSARRHR